jgi:flagella basal body P-ring formation protein FlgA
MRRNGALLAILGLPFILAFGGELTYQSHESILAAIDRLLEQELHFNDHEYHIEPIRLDPRLRLPECERPLEAFILSGNQESGSLSMGVRCSGNQPWTLYNKVHLRTFRQVVVLRNSVKQGKVISQSDLILENRNLSTLRGEYFTAPEEVVGRMAKRSLPKGLVVVGDHFVAPMLIRRGQKVIIRAKSANVEVNMSGEALADGNEGQRIRIRNERSQAIVEGTIVGPGVVVVDR